MAVFRARVDLGGNNVQSQPPGGAVLSQTLISSLTTAGAGSITVAMLLGGILNRSGPTGGYTDTFPTATDVLNAQPELSVGDSFDFIFRNTVAQAMTAAAGEGCVLGTHVDIAASLVREYLVTILGTGPRQITSGTVTNGSATVTAIPLAAAALIQPGQGVTGTNVPANTFVTAVNAATGVVTMSANATPGSGNVSLTFFPRYQLQGVRSSTL
jgi:hypothetical protein